MYVLCVEQTGQTPLSIAQRLGYISVVETLKHVTEVTVEPSATDEKYKVVSPETMQETLMTDSEDEGGRDHDHHDCLCHCTPTLDIVSTDAEPQ